MFLKVALLGICSHFLLFFQHALISAWINGIKISADIVSQFLIVGTTKIMLCVFDLATVLKHLSNRLNTDCFLFHTFTIFVKVNYVGLAEKQL